MPDLSILTLEYEVAPKSGVQLRYWLGALLRNNLLYAASSIRVEGDTTLLEVIQGTDNLLPRGYSIQCDPIFGRPTLSSGDRLRFSIRLFGNFSAWAEHFHAAVLAMCRRGLGLPMTPLEILSCRKYRSEVPFGLSAGPHLSLSYVTPVSIYNGRAMPQARRTSLDLQNGMPGFYFLVRSLVRRINKLQYAYEGGELWSDEQVDEWCLQAREAQLEECSLRRVVLEGPPRQHSERPIYFRGYVGQAVYSDVSEKYLPLLWKGMETNVGNDTVYGMGQYLLGVKTF